MRICLGWTGGDYVGEGHMCVEIPWRGYGPAFSLFYIPIFFLYFTLIM